MADNNHQQSIEPAHVTIRVGCAYTGDSRSRMYAAIGNGEVQAVKEGRRTLLVFESLKRRVAARQPAKIGVTKVPTAEDIAAFRKRASKKNRKRRRSA